MQRQSLIKLIHVNSASGFSCVTAAEGGEGWDDMLSEQFQPTIDHHASTGGGGVQSSISASFTHKSVEPVRATTKGLCVSRNWAAARRSARHVYSGAAGGRVTEYSNDVETTPSERQYCDRPDRQFAFSRRSLASATPGCLPLRPCCCAFLPCCRFHGHTVHVTHPHKKLEAFC